MSEIHLTEEQKAQQAYALQKEKAVIDRKLGEWVLEQGWAVVPKIHYTPQGMNAVLDFEKLPEKRLEELREQLAKEKGDGN